MRNKKDIVIVLLSFVGLGVLVWLARFLFESFFAGGGITSENPLFFSLVTISSLIDSVNPCAFSVLLLTIAFLFNMQKSRKEILMIGGAYIFGIFAMYLFIGFGILQALSLFGIPNFVSKMGAWLIIVFGVINLVGHFFQNFPIHFKLPKSAHPYIARFIGKGSFLSALLLGAFVGLFEFPCTGGPYLMILGLLHDGATVMRGAGYLLWYNFVFVLPLIIMLFVASRAGLLEKVNIWRKENTGEMKLFSGIAMISLGLLILFLSR